LEISRANPQPKWEVNCRHRSWTVPHKPSARTIVSISLSLVMDKDMALVSATEPDYHDGLREKTNNPAHNESAPYASGSQENRAFQVGPAPKSSLLPHCRRSNCCNQRYINQLAISNFMFTTQSAWEALALTFQVAWLNGGPVALIYGSFISAVGATLVALSLAEMASMYMSTLDDLWFCTRLLTMCEQ
jgi:hypothetical protein